MSGLLDKRTSVATVKLIIFIVVTTLATGVLVVLIGNLTFESSRSYKAVLSDATGVVGGDDVRIAGVKVGTVQGVDVIDRDRALVSFDVYKSAMVTKSSQLEVRYRNLVGQRYLSIDEGVGDTSMLPADSTIPLSRTKPALDLTVLFNGFKPLFTALSPTDINKLSYELIQVFQGEGTTLESLLQSTASITSTLANRDQLIGDLIDNLDSVLTTVRNRDGELSQLIINFRQLVAGLTQDRQAILGTFNSISSLTSQTAGLVQGVRPGLVRSISGLRKVATNLNRGRGELDRALQVLPIKLNKVGRTAIYGSFFNFYLCQAQGTLDIPSNPLTDSGVLSQAGLKTGRNTLTLPVPDSAGRCDLR